MSTMERDTERGRRGRHGGCCGGSGCCGGGHGHGRRQEEGDVVSVRRDVLEERRRDLEEQLADVTEELRALRSPAR